MGWQKKRKFNNNKGRKLPLYEWSLTGQQETAAQIKTASEEAAIDHLLYNYDFLRLATPIKPIRPEPNNQTAAGRGITVGITK